MTNTLPGVDTKIGNILALMSDGAAWTAPELGAELDIAPANVRAMLKNALDAGHVQRRRVRPRGKHPVFEWWHAEFPEPPMEDGDEIEGPVMAKPPSPPPPKIIVSGQYAIAGPRLPPKRADLPAHLVAHLAGTPAAIRARNR